MSRENTKGLIRAFIESENEDKQAEFKFLGWIMKPELIHYFLISLISPSFPMAVCFGPKISIKVPLCNVRELRVHYAEACKAGTG